MASFQPTERKRLPRLKEEATPEKKYWTAYSDAVTSKEYGAIQSISFARSKPHLCAVTSPGKVDVIRPDNLEVHKSFTRFKEAAKGASLRDDGKLLSVGGDEGIVRVFDVGTKSLLREFKNSKAPVFCTRFAPDNTHVLSFGDDRCVRYYDVPAQTQLRVFKDHGDYVRTGDVGVTGGDLVVSGCYDHFGRVLDLRTTEVVSQVDHGAPVESVLLFPAGNVFLTAGGTMIKVWDLVSLSRPLASLSFHHKTITDLCFASHYKRFLSSSIDRHVKVYDVASYSLIHSMDFAAPVMSVGVSLDDELLCVGMSDGVVSFHKRRPPVDEDAVEQRQLAKRKLTKYLMKEKSFQPAPDSIVVSEEVRPLLQRQDKYLKSFQFSKALDRVLKFFVWGQTPQVTVAMIEELDRRDGLASAVAGRSADELIDLLAFLCRYITDPRFSHVLLGLTDLLWIVGLRRKAHSRSTNSSAVDNCVQAEACSDVFTALKTVGSKLVRGKFRVIRADGAALALGSETYPCMFGQSRELDSLIDKLEQTLKLEVQCQNELKQTLSSLDVLMSLAEINIQDPSLLDSSDDDEPNWKEDVDKAVSVVTT